VVHKVVGFNGVEGWLGMGIIVNVSDDWIGV
jgi:hypothetical protein